MVIIAWRTLRKFAKQARYKDARTPLAAWRRLMEESDFADPHELKDVFPKVTILKGSRAVFNVGGNKYRLLVLIAYRVRTVYVKWIGTHEDYDKLDLG